MTNGPNQRSETWSRQTRLTDSRLAAAQRCQTVSQSPLLDSLGDTSPEQETGQEPSEELVGVRPFKEILRRAEQRSALLPQQARKVIPRYLKRTT